MERFFQALMIVDFYGMAPRITKAMYRSASSPNIRSVYESTFKTTVMHGYSHKTIEFILRPNIIMILPIYV